MTLRRLLPGILIVLGLGWIPGHEVLAGPGMKGPGNGQNGNGNGNGQQEDAPDPEPVVSVINTVTMVYPSVTARAGSEFSLNVLARSEEPIRTLGIRLYVNPDLIQLIVDESDDDAWDLGSGLRAHIEGNGEPESCDVVVYPDVLINRDFI